MAQLAELTGVFARIGVLSFGGPAAQIALMHRELVDRRSWLSEDEYLRALSFCMLLPGPEAMQLATYAGWRLQGVRGGLIAGLLFVLPGACVVMALALAYVFFGSLPLVEALFLGVKAAVIAIVIEALFKVARRALKSRTAYMIAGSSFLAIFAFGLPFPVIIGAAAIWGFLSGGGVEPAKATRPDLRALGRTVAVWGSVWLAPIALLWASGAQFLTEIALFFSKLAVVTFGGAYAVLAYMTQEVVEERGWLSTAEMIDGLGLAETTPGPLILVTEFVAFLAGFGIGGAGLAFAAALTALWVTFVPCFLWIFAGAPYLEWIAARPRLTGALSAITAAVVGVILNLSIWFGLHVLFSDIVRTDAGPVTLLTPVWSSLEPVAAGLASLAALMLLGFGWPLLRVLSLSAGLGLFIGLALT
ncbi:MAG: chromate efflux transporter [Pseudomonadota bacterium]